MTNSIPPHVQRMLDAFDKPIKRLWEGNVDGRRDHTFARNAALIAAPWDYDGAVVEETREITFLRDFFNIFYECLQSCQALDVVSVLMRQTFTVTPDKHMSTVITFWSESYLNEVYILQLRLRDFVTFAERKYKRDKDFAEPIIEVCKQLRAFIDEHLSPFISSRGRHVHERRYRNIDPELARLAVLNTSIDILDQKDLIETREKAIDEARDWLFRQTDKAAEACWVAFDGACQVLAEGIVTDNDWIIVPLPFKDNPDPFMKDYRADT